MVGNGRKDMDNMPLRKDASDSSSNGQRRHLLSGLHGVITRPLGAGNGRSTDMESENWPAMSNHP